MSKSDVIDRFGKPYKKEFFTDANGATLERLQYARFVLGNLYEVYFLEFDNDKLISMYSPPYGALYQRSSIEPTP
ncbi:hypothetical protein [Niabella ginsengisoli]|uniref:Uncharacterized protein n=1 Tax=Niabella ginsengisoli TaxID=522298 RepID=A0ABS9SM68_9BACT|nr:hypothetical protein [Niabella ginsengisoli]MCH5599361.1 hypothetical protein [Niabella ginsengisoli]